MIQRIETQFRESAAGKWFEGLIPRDRLVVMALAVALVLALAWVLIWQPVHDWSTAAQQRHEEQSALIEWMKMNELQARDAGRSAGSSRSASGSLLTLVANSAAEAGIQLNRVQPEGGGGVSVVLQNQPFSEVLRWLGELSTRHQVTIRQVSIDKQPAPGIVNVRVNMS